MRCHKKEMPFTDSEAYRSLPEQLLDHVTDGARSPGRTCSLRQHSLVKNLDSGIHSFDL